MYLDKDVCYTSDIQVLAEVLHEDFVEMRDNYNIGGQVATFERGSISASVINGTYRFRKPDDEMEMLDHDNNRYQGNLAYLVATWKGLVA
jgi:hypothetical protein